MSLACSASNVTPLTKQQINTLKRDDMVKYAIKITSAYEFLHDKLFNPESGVIAKLEEQIESSKRTNQFLIEKINSLERSLHSTEQYTRKESIEFKGFDTEISHKDMEGYVLDVLNEIKEENEAPYTADDIQACHKLRNKKMVICRFVSRKRMRAAVNSRKKLKNKDLQRYGVSDKLVMFEAMSPHFKSMNWRCNQLVKAGRIKDSWFFNGKYFVHPNDGDKTTVITDDDLQSLLGLSAKDIDKICEDWKKKPRVRLPREPQS